jgi:DNA-binding NarL/FixJ family response regulator
LVALLFQPNSVSEFESTRHSVLAVTRILLLGGQELCRAGFRTLLQSSAEFEVIEEGARGHAAIRLAKKLNTNVILMDMANPDAEAIEATREIHGAQPNIHIIVLSAPTSRQHLFDAFQAGAVGFVSKDSAAPELSGAIHAVLTSGTYLSPSAAHLVLDRYGPRAQAHPQRGELDTLSKREREVLKFLADGYSSVAIAKAVHISPRTVDAHRQNLMKKLEIYSVACLTRFAIRHGLSSI